MWLGGHKKVKKSYSQRKRDNFNYRSAYFRKNPGMLGKYWRCAYCGAILKNPREVQVDHIIPLNNRLGINAEFNTIAACAKCNNAKSDKFDYRVILGILAKLMEKAYYLVASIFKSLFGGVVQGVMYIPSKVMQQLHFTGIAKFLVAAAIVLVIIKLMQ